MKTRSLALLCCILFAAALAFSQTDDGFQMAHVVSFEKTAANAQHMTDSDNYKISMRMNGILYNCRANAPAATFIDWSMGKEFPAKESGKTLLVKNPNGQIVELNIVKKKAGS